MLLGNSFGICPSSRLGTRAPEQEGRGHDLGCSLLGFSPDLNPQNSCQGKGKGL